MEYKSDSRAWEKSLKIAKIHFKTADHMAYVNLLILKDNRMIIKILNELAISASLAITSVLQKEKELHNGHLFSDHKKNLDFFTENLAKKYIDKLDLANLLKLLKIKKAHIAAPLEFVKRDKFIIFLGEKYETITPNLLKELLSSVRIFLTKI